MTAKLTPSESIHFLENGFTFSTSDNASTGHVSRRGQVVVITTALLEASQDRLGASWLDLVDDAEGQKARWGKHMFGRGEFPASQSLFVAGSVEWELAREARRVAAHAIPDHHERAVALRNLNTEFGPGPSGQRSVSYGSDQREQEA